MPSNKAAKAALAGNNLILVLMLVSFLAVGAGVLVGKSLVATILLNKKVLDAKIKADKQLATDYENSSKLVAEYGNLGPLARLVNDSLPTTKDIPGILVTLENMGLQSGLTIKSVAPVTVGSTASAAGSTETSNASSTTGPVPAEKVGVPQPQSFVVTVGFNGSYTALQKFLADVETSVRPMRLVNLQLSGGGNSLGGQADIQTYYQDKASLPIETETIK
ncbi:MAG TPA: hypothetical protein VI322_05390 [Candidatus Saccharimonadia bacterium]